MSAYIEPLHIHIKDISAVAPMEDTEKQLCWFDVHLNSGSIIRWGQKPLTDGGLIDRDAGMHYFVCQCPHLKTI